VASRAAVSIASAGLDVAGRAGARAGSAPERLLRDARVFPIVEGTTEIQELILGRHLVEPGRFPNS
jgi:acyl-CoA dehydrogenase